MPTRSSGPDVLVDTSAAVALVVEDHEGHAVTFAALNRRRLGLAGHAAFETFSVLTRLPGPSRRPAAVISRLLTVNFPHNRFLSARGAAALLLRLAGAGIGGGSVYDALIGATAAEYRLPLATRDHRAVATYAALGVDVELLT